MEHAGSIAFILDVIAYKFSRDRVISELKKFGGDAVKTYDVLVAELEPPKPKTINFTVTGH